MKAKLDTILMNPPYNSKPKMIPPEYQQNWGKASDGKEDPTKGLVFVKYLSDIAKAEDWNGTKLAALLPMSAAIGTSSIISDMKQALLEDNTLEAVFSLPAEIFYPGASVQACCMLFTLNKPHFDSDGKINKATFFGYYKDDAFKKKKNLGRVEQFDSEGRSRWKDIEERWLRMYRDKSVVAGLSAMQPVTGSDEWLCEAYMKTDYSKLTEADFQRTINNYVSYLVKTSKIENADEAVNTENWKEFLLNDYFDIMPGKYHYPEEYKDGKTPYYSASAENNGIGSYISLPPDFEGNCVVTGKVGCTAFFAPEPFCATSDVNIFKPRFHMSSEVGLMLATIINFNENYKWAYGRQCRVGNSKKISLQLPATSDGEPDWEFMELFMKKHYQKVTPPHETRIKSRRIPLEIHKMERV